MPFSPVDPSIPPPRDADLPTPEVIDVPADLPTLEPDVVVSFPLNEVVTDMVVVPDEHDGRDVIYVAVTQERVNVWAAAVYFTPEIALGVTAVVVLFALRKFWVSRRFTHRRGEAYCRKCWAGLNGVTSATCPECGRAVKKTRRTAKRSKRSLAHPRWRWLLAALVMTLGTTVLWFGESWYGLYSNGFDGQDPDDWWALIDPVDRVSPVRINKAAGWFDWYSADLAMHARENDAAWVETLSWEYAEDEGLQYQLQIRRYATTDGRCLSSDPFPAQSIYQNQSSDNSSDIKLIHLPGLVIASDYDGYYRYRHDAAERWLLYGEADPNIRYETVALTSDARHLVFGQRVLEGGPGVRFGREINAVPLQVAVHVAATGERVSLLQTADGAPRVDGDDPEVRELAADGYPAWEVDFTTDRFLPLDDGNILLVGRLGLAVWHLNVGKVVDVPEFTLEPEMLRDDLWADLQWRPELIYEPADMPPDSAFFRQLAASRRLQRAWMPVGYLAAAHRYDYGFALDQVPDEFYNLESDVLLYEVTADALPHRPDRSIRFPFVPMEFGPVSLSPRGDWMTLYDLKSFNGDLQPVPFLVDLENNAAVGLFEGTSFNDAVVKFINDGTQAIVFNRVENPGPQNYSRYRRDEVHLYDLPPTGGGGE